MVGATVEEKGFDLAVQAGAVGDLLDDARRLVPALEEYELVDTTTGLRPGSPDNAPIVGATEVRGLVVATGHYRNGILLAPLTAGEVVGVLAGRTSAPCGAAGPFAPFGPDRFAAGARPTGGADPPGTRAGRRSARERRPGQRDALGRRSPGPRWPSWWRRGARRPAASPWPATATSSPGAAGSGPRSMAGDRIEIVTAAAGG